MSALYRPDRRFVSSRVGTVKGYCLKWNVLGRHLRIGNWKAREVIAPSAFDRTLRGTDDVFLTIDHDYPNPLAWRSDFTLRLEKDSIGVYFEADIPDTVDGRRLVAERHNVNGCSFSMDNERYEAVLVDGEQARLIRRADLTEICVSLPPGGPIFPQTWAKVEPV